MENRREPGKQYTNVEVTDISECLISIQLKPLVDLGRLKPHLLAHHLPVFGLAQRGKEVRQRQRRAAQEPLFIRLRLVGVPQVEEERLYFEHLPQMASHVYIIGWCGGYLRFTKSYGDRRGFHPKLVNSSPAWQPSGSQQPDSESSDRLRDYNVPDKRRSRCRRQRSRTQQDYRLDLGLTEFSSLCSFER